MRFSLLRNRLPLSRCIFSIGGDGALHVLDDADATGYIKPSTKRQKSLRKRSSQRSTGGEGWRGDSQLPQRPARTTSAGWGLDAPPASSQRPSRGTGWGLGGEAAHSRPCSRASSTALSTGEPRAKRFSGTCGRGESSNQVSTCEAYVRRGEGRQTTSKSPDRARHGDVHHGVVDDSQAGLSTARGRGEGGGWSVLLRQVIFSSGNSDGEQDEEGGAGTNGRGLQGLNSTAHPRSQGLRAAPNGVGFARTQRPTASSVGGKEPTPPYSANPEHCDGRAKRAIVVDSSGTGKGDAGVRTGSQAGSPPAVSESNSIGRRLLGSALDMPGCTSANPDGTSVPAATNARWERCMLR